MKMENAPRSRRAFVWTGTALGLHSSNHQNPAGQPRGSGHGHGLRTGQNHIARSYITAQGLRQGRVCLLDHLRLCPYNENDFHQERCMSAELWLQALQEHGYRLTESRRAVVEIVAASSRALTPLEVFDLARAAHSDLGLVTVYRTLEKLEELHLIQRVHQPGGCQAFLAASQGHQHLLLCQHCGQATFFEGDNLDQLFATIAQKTGYVIKDHWLQLFGLCQNCQ
ncbi:MAG: hypothetical protein DDG60_13230 [Anaerolineae bacterium]|nr:MAG: hypothetical protein DDG60_13230 [Anaerolineae bacterium]